LLRLPVNMISSHAPSTSSAISPRKIIQFLHVFQSLLHDFQSCSFGQLRNLSKTDQAQIVYYILSVKARFRGPCPCAFVCQMCQKQPAPILSVPFPGGRGGLGCIGERRPKDAASLPLYWCSVKVVCKGQAIHSPALSHSMKSALGSIGS